MVATAQQRKRVYIAGPISKGGLCENVNRATEAFVALAKAGFAPMCPHWSVYSKPARPRQRFAFELAPGCEDPYKLTDRGDECICFGTAMGNEEMSHADWMGVDLPWVAASDAVLRLPGESTGADMETAHANAVGVPVFDSLESLLSHFVPHPEADHRVYAPKVAGPDLRVGGCPECPAILGPGLDGSEHALCPACGHCAHPSMSAKDGHWCCNACDRQLEPLSPLIQG